MNCLIITFSDHKVYTSFKLIVDNFYLTHQRLRSGRPAPGCSSKMEVEMADFWEFGSLRISEHGPGIRKRDASSTENGRFLGVWEFELDKFVPRAPGGKPESYPQVINSY